jgi:hypothetical protein
VFSPRERQVADGLKLVREKRQKARAAFQKVSDDYQECWSETPLLRRRRFRFRRAPLACVPTGYVAGLGSGHLLVRDLCHGSREPSMESCVVFAGRQGRGDQGGLGEGP